jgi:uncharacterized protein
MSRADELIEIALANPANAEILRRLPDLGVPESFLVAGCLFQAVWNRLSGWPPERHVKDYDVFYFDDRDLSWDAEDRVIRRAKDLFSGLGVEVEVKNQARVHLWYRDRFGADYPRLNSSEDGIDRYLSTCTCIGIRVETGSLYAPYGLDELWAGILRMNPANAQPERFLEKAESYRSRWPWLTIVPPD